MNSQLIMNQSVQHHLLKFIVQLACGGILIASGTCIDLFEAHWLNVAITLLWVVGMMNSINMLDNMDGDTLISNATRLKAEFAGKHKFLLESSGGIDIDNVQQGGHVGFAGLAFRQDVQPVELGEAVVVQHAKSEVQPPVDLFRRQVGAGAKQGVPVCVSVPRPGPSNAFLRLRLD